MPNAITCSWIPTILVMALGCLWGAHFSIIKITVESGLPLGAIIVGTASGAAFALIIISGLRRRLPPLSLRHLRFYVLCALLSYGLPFFLELTVAKHLAASLLAVIVTTDPIFTTAIAVLWRRENVPRKRILGIAIGAATILVVFIPTVALPASDLFGWTLFAFAVPASYALYHTYVASAWPVGLDAWQAGTGEATASLLIFLPLAAWHGDLSSLKAGWSAGHLMIVLMALSAVLEAYLYFEIIRRAGAVFVSQASFVTVITGMLWGMAIFDEKPDQWLWLCAGLLMYSLYLTRHTDISAR